MVAPSPSPRRVKAPSWLDARLILGVVLVLGSVLVGAVVVGRAHRTTPAVTAAHDLAAGTVLSTDDLTVTRVQLDDRSAARYASDPYTLVGRQLQRPVGAGELVPTGATRKTPPLTTLPVLFSAGDAPALRAGQRIELWLSGPGCPSVVLLPDVTVQSTRSVDSGFGNGGDAQSIVISIDPSLAERVVAAQAMRDARIKAGILTGDAAPSLAELPDITACASAPGR